MAVLGNVRRVGIGVFGPPDCLIQFAHVSIKSLTGRTLAGKIIMRIT
jgi:hypothetical protein